MNVPIEWIEPNPKNPRKNFDPVYLQELAESIKSVGIIQPLVVVLDEAVKIKLQKKLGKELVKEIVDLNKIGHEGFERLNAQGNKDIDQTECQTCEHRKTGKWYSENDVQACLNPSCMRKKKMALTKERNKAAREAYKKEVELVDKTFEERSRSTIGFDNTDLVYIAANILCHVQKNYSEQFKRPTQEEYLEKTFGIKGFSTTYYTEDGFKKMKKALLGLDSIRLRRIIMEWPVLARGTDEALTKWYLDECKVRTVSTCPYFGGVTQKGKKHLIKCGKDYLSFGTKELADDQISKTCEKQMDDCRPFLFRQLEEMGIAPTSEWSTERLKDEYLKRNQPAAG